MQIQFFCKYAQLVSVSGYLVPVFLFSFLLTAYQKETEWN